MPAGTEITARIWLLHIHVRGDGTDPMQAAPG